MNLTKKKWLLPVGAVLVICLLAIAVVTTMTGTGSEKSEFLSTFQLDTATKNVQLEEVYNDRGWFGDGTALYQVTLGEDGDALTAEWDDLPLSQDAETLLEWESDSISLPDITEGKWMLVDRGEDSESSTNVSLCVFDEGTGTAWYVTIDT
ncbi:MAG: hypothetical protein LUD78_10000 [Clostridiales bacterium]|nr:hypothetical protein [Clostridiales bacterium]